VRRDGNRIVPYWTRQDIEAGKAGGLPTLAWVDDAQALYLMQVQGSGRIRMPDGKSIRLSYADQNGHPFRPRGATPPSRTRSLPGGAGTEPVAVATPVSMRALEVAGATRQRGRPLASDQDVDRVVDALLAQPPRAKSDRTAPPARRASAPGGESTGGDDARTVMDLGYLVSARENDPSYVFFQPATAEGSGPVGALGVPLTATRSIAVDPRSTPLGSPVFIEAERDDSGEPLRRLVIAQDTGGAIRGAVRADFFWGTGPKAGAQAVRTRDDLAMWVLLPKGFSPQAAGSRTRSLGGAAAECVMPDAEYCLE
jgi:membrane-bound lytic murein transglycosylase A